MKLRTASALFMISLTACGAKAPDPAKPSAREQQLSDERDEANARTLAVQHQLEQMQQEMAASNKNLQTMIEELSNKVTEIKNQPPSRPAQRPAPDPAQVYAIPIGDSPQEGPNNALVTIVRAYEYACPFCEKSRATMDQLRQKYGQDLRIVYRPLVVHPSVATGPALASCAAHRQGKWKVMDDLLWDQVFKTRAFDKNECWKSNSCSNLDALAVKLNLSASQFHNDMQSICEQDLRTSMSMFATFGVSATPGFFINGRFLSGAQPIENFSVLIDEELAKAKTAVKNGTPAVKYYQRNVIDAGRQSLAAAVVP
jgi:protein-disulfide isomerase